MILNYLILFSLLIMSVIKVTDFMFKADQKLQKERLQFISETKKTLKKGNISLMAAIMTLMLSALLLFFATKNKIELNESRYRKKSYLCFHSLNIETNNYIKSMGRFNLAIRTAFIATRSGVAAIPARLAFESLVKIRNVRHFYYIKSLIKNSHCPLSIIENDYLKKLPYKTNQSFSLDTNYDETSILRANQWTILLYLRPNGIRLKNSFALKAEYDLKSAFSTNYNLKTSEIAKTDFSILNLSSGHPSFF